jgi:hypothetical protein
MTLRQRNPHQPDFDKGNGNPSDVITSVITF